MTLSDYTKVFENQILNLKYNSVSQHPVQRAAASTLWNITQYSVAMSNSEQLPLDVFPMNDAFMEKKGKAAHTALIETGKSIPS